jgi:hypothetical protein
MIDATEPETDRIMRATCDLCNISVLRVPVDPDEALLHLVKTGWINLVVMGDRLDVCPTCQTIARALQIADASVAANQNAYPKAYEEPTA